MKRKAEVLDDAVQAADFVLLGVNRSGVGMNFIKGIVLDGIGEVCEQVHPFRSGAATTGFPGMGCWSGQSGAVQAVGERGGVAQVGRGRTGWGGTANVCEGSRHQERSGTHRPTEGEVCSRSHGALPGDQFGEMGWINILVRGEDSEVVCKIRSGALLREGEMTYEGPPPKPVRKEVKNAIQAMYKGRDRR